MNVVALRVLLFSAERARECAKWRESEQFSPLPAQKMFNLLLIGDSGVGKTCILNRFSDDAFSSSKIATIGIDFKIRQIEVNGQKVRLQIWDTAGQERFHAITTSYYRKADGIVLVYDITDAKSFDSISRWIRNIDENASEDVVKMLLGNKCDMADRRAVSKERGEQVASAHSLPFLETSAKGNVNVDAAFYEMAGRILEKKPTERVVVDQVDMGASGGASSLFGCCA